MNSNQHTRNHWSIAAGLIVLLMGSLFFSCSQLSQGVLANLSNTTYLPINGNGLPKTAALADMLQFTPSGGTPMYFIHSSAVYASDKPGTTTNSSGVKVSNPLTGWKTIASPSSDTSLSCGSLVATNGANASIYAVFIGNTSTAQPTFYRMNTGNFANMSGASSLSGSSLWTQLSPSFNYANEKPMEVFSTSSALYLLTSYLPTDSNKVPYAALQYALYRIDNAWNSNATLVPLTTTDSVAAKLPVEAIIQESGTNKVWVLNTSAVYSIADITVQASSSSPIQMTRDLNLDAAVPTSIASRGNPRYAAIYVIPPPIPNANPALNVNDIFIVSTTGLIAKRAAGQSGWAFSSAVQSDSVLGVFMFTSITEVTLCDRHTQTPNGAPTADYTELVAGTGGQGLVIVDPTQLTAAQYSGGDYSSTKIYGATGQGITQLFNDGSTDTFPLFCMTPSFGMWSCVYDNSLSSPGLTFTSE